MTTVTLPPPPPAVPDLTVDPGGIRTFGSALLAASAQVDDLGSFVAGDARIPHFTGAAGTAYADTIAPIGHRADAMSLALRGVGQRVDVHADTMAQLLERRTDLVSARGHLVDVVRQLQGEVAGLKEADVPEFQGRCDDVTHQVRGLATEIETWQTDVATEEEAMRRAFERVLTLDQVERRYGGVADPADSALATKPGPGASPEEVCAWWNGLTREQQQAIFTAAPGAIGNLDGIPPWARDGANRVSLTRDLGDWGNLDRQGLLTPDEQQWYDNARSAQSALGSMGRGVDPITGEAVKTQLYLYDPMAFDGDGRVAISAGDLDTADNVAVITPGFGTDAGSAGAQGQRALTVYEASRFLDPAKTNATMFWIGYDAPDNPPWEKDGDWSGVTQEGMATEGGARLADTLDGLRASHTGDPAHLTAIGHSYGSTTLGHAAHDHGIPVDDVVFVGSPGVGGDTDSAADTGVDPHHVWAGANSRDPIADLGNHGWVHGETLGGAGLGDDPAEDDFGAIRFEAESTTRADDAIGLDAFADHSKYFDHDTEALHNIASIVNGDYGDVQQAGHVHDPWYAGPQDPEFDRDATSPQTRR
jgi:hypothetical protein